MLDLSIVYPIALLGEMLPLLDFVIHKVQEAI
jgi:hypothetical protein